MSENFDFGKKKKKQPKKVEEEQKNDELEQQEVKEANEVSQEDVGKKKKKSVDEEPKPKTEATVAQPAGAETNRTDEEYYTYDFLVKRVYDSVNNSGENEKTKYTMKPPVVYLEGTKKTVWSNFPEICKIMNRQPEHVFAFILVELATTGSIDGNGRLVVKGRFQPKHIENLLRRYIAEYVKCHTCKKPETHLKKENRLVFMVCDSCGSTRTVMPIKTGFQATTRADRRAART